MDSLDSQSIRDAFTHFFVQKGHTAIQRSSLIPHNDPTLLFVNSGMVQFKDVFLGSDLRAYKRATTIQPSVRAGGKHNDLDNVGYTARHHTFFEMLGNFSFGDYFKQDAIKFAWEFLTQILKLPKEKLWVTVYEQDQEAADIWINQIGVDPKRLSKIGAKDNFWQMGDTGPCGPCSEIFYDHGDSIFGGPPGSPDADGDRYIEIWNLVFMQYNKDSAGNLTPLPKPSVDTGMGLERLAAILQGVHDNYEIDTFQFLIQKTAELLKTKDLDSKSLRVIADHIRSISFLITDGVIPSNEGRGYVLRRIIRRAIRHGEKLGAQKVFLYQLVDPLIQIMGQAYPELQAHRNLICELLEKEEIQFLKTLENGLKLLHQSTQNLINNNLPGDLVFKLYDTYGFPIDLTQDIAREKSWTVDMAGFEQAMAEQKERARSAGSFKEAYKSPVGLNQKTKFLGYEVLESESLIEKIYLNGQEVAELFPGEKAQVILNQSPFYGESGGQVGDQGVLEWHDNHHQNNLIKFIVHDTQKQGEAICHYGELIHGKLKPNQKIIAKVSSNLRNPIKKNHSATHLLDSALRKVLGDHVLQKGSQVKPENLRFDFAHSKALSREELVQIENLVNQEILKNHPVETINTDINSAKKLGAIALFGEKYGEMVRILKMGDFSLEFCGGTHVAHTGEIGLFKILSESSVASGIRRIEAITGEAALAYVQKLEQEQRELLNLLKIPKDKLLDKIKELLDKNKDKNKDLNSKNKSENYFQNLINQAQDLDLKNLNLNIKLLSCELAQDSISDPKKLREISDLLKPKLKLLNPNFIICLGIIIQGKVNFVVAVSEPLQDKIKAGDLISHIAPIIGGKGGGRADFAQAGGTKPESLSEALTTVKTWVLSQTTN